jgi:hypothetical protein
VLTLTSVVEDRKTVPVKFEAVEASTRYPWAELEEPCCAAAGSGVHETAALDGYTSKKPAPVKGLDTVQVATDAV